MPSPAPASEPTLPVFTDSERRAPAIAWYRTAIPPAEFKALHRRSDALGAAQTLAYLALLAGPCALAVAAARLGHWWVAAGAVSLYGTVASFLINAVHELGHGTVFRTKWLNRLCTRGFAFLGAINFEKFEHSHTRHHRYTLHPPDDLEVVLPIRLLVRHVFKTGLVNPRACWNHWREVWRIARGRFEGDWETLLFPAHDPARGKDTVRWARTLLAGHGLIAAVSLWLGWWIVPVLLSGGPFIGGWLHFLCNNTQHIGLRDNVPDFRLCCRTFTLHPLVRILYWHMNYHTEHHMYAAVPCYRLGRLHALIRHDLPPCASSLAAVWREISQIQKRQETEPGYQPHPLEPGVPVAAGG